MIDEVLRLGVAIDFADDDPFASGAPVDQVDLTVRQFGDLADGRRVVIDDAHGWSTRCSTAGDVTAPGGMWAQTLKRDRLAEDVRRVLLPDDDEQARAEDRPWAWLVARFAAHGVRTTAEQLRRLPLDFEISERLRARGRDAANEPAPGAPTPHAP